MSDKLALVSDLDDTFLGDPEALARFANFFPAVQERVSIIYASGRFFPSIAQDIRSKPLPDPLAVIAGVGSEIRSYPDGRLNQNWVDRISRNWSSSRIRQLLCDEPELHLQPEECQSDFKVSYYFYEASQEQLNRLRAKLFDCGINASVIYSSKRDLDFLPEGVNKGTAAAFLTRELGFDAGAVLVAGNSANDSKLFEHDFHGIIVSNAHEELKAYANTERVYQSSMARADGVRDGLEYWLKRLWDREVA